MLAKGRGNSNVLCAVPMLEHFHNETSFRGAVRPQTWKEEMNQLIDGTMAAIAQCVWAGRFHLIKRRRVGYMVAPESFQDFGRCLMKAIMNFPTNGVGPKCNTWSVFCSGDICVTCTSTVSCIEQPQTGFVMDGAPKIPKRFHNGNEYQRNDVATVNKTLG